MKKYILFDSGCPLCTKIANEIEEETKGVLSSRSLRDPQVQSMLNQLKPNWQWEPMLLETDDQGNPKSISCNTRMYINLVWLLGLVDAFSLYRKLQSQLSEAKIGEMGQKRRQFLKRAGSFAALTTVFGIFLNAKNVSSNTIYLPTVHSGVKPATLSEAEQARSIVMSSSLLEYVESDAYKNGLQVMISDQELEATQIEGNSTIFKSDSCVVFFLGEREGRRIFQVMIGTKEIDTILNENNEISDTVLVSFVDITNNEVADIVQTRFSTSEITASSSTALVNMSLKSLYGRKLEYAIQDGKTTLIKDEQSTDIVTAAGIDPCSALAAASCLVLSPLSCYPLCAGLCILATSGIACFWCGPICNGAWWTFCAFYVHCD